MSKAVVIALLCGLVLALVGAVRYLSRPAHVKRGNVGSAGEHFGPQDLGSQGGHGGGV
jgi:hypothetical protein